MKLRSAHHEMLSQKRNAKLTLALIVFSIALLAVGETNGEPWVASPYRASKVKWEIPKTAGSDFTILLNYAAWRNKKGLQDEPFIKESGIASLRLPFIMTNEKNLRTIVLKEVEVYQEAVAENSAGKAVFSIDPKEKETVILDMENINDGNVGTSCVITADPQPVKKRYLPAEASIDIKLQNNSPVSKIVIRHGADGSAMLSKVFFFALNNDEAVKLEPSEMKNTGGVLTASFKNAPKVESVRLECVSDRLVYSLGNIPAEENERMKKYPFYVEPPMRISLGSLLGLNEENFDKDSFSAFRKKYEKTFLGFRLAEWDSNFFVYYTYAKRYKPGTADFSSYVTNATDKVTMAQNLNNMWDYQKSLFKKVYGLSGQVNYPHYGMEHGGTIAGMELSGESAAWPHRNNLLFTRGAARQYNSPWLLFLAYYASNYTPSSTLSGETGGTIYGVNYGIPPSLGLRLFYLSYYMGNSFLDFECQPWGQVKEEADGTCVLTKNGEAIKEIFEWTHSEKGKRGSCYTPILLLMDYYHGHDMWKRIPSWTTWYGLFPFDDGDYMAEHIMRVIDPDYGDVGFGFDNPKYSANLHNSTLGDIFDLYVANPPSGAVRMEQLDKYPVIILMDDIKFTTELVGNLKTYVAKGGTLLINSGHSSILEKAPAFLGVSPSTSFVEDDGMKIQKFSPLESAKVLLSSTKGIPLLIKNKYGKGNVLFTTPVFMLQSKDKTTASPMIAKVLEKIKSEVLPVKVEGDIHCLFNIMPDGTWKVILINNRGIVKLPGSSTETHDPAFTSEVRIIAPSGVTAKEIRTGAEITETERAGEKVFTLKVPPAGIMVVDLEKLNVKSSSDDLIGEWKFDEGTGQTAKDSSGNNRDIKLSDVEYAKIKSGSCLNYSKPKSSASLSFPIEYQIKEGSYEIWAAPELNGKFETESNKNRGDIVNSENIMLTLCDKKWDLMIVDRNIILTLNGPKAESKKWTHLVVTWSGFLCHLYVDGQEVKGPTGPLKFSNDIVNISSGNMKIFLGSGDTCYPKSFPFRGL
ncbi:MAG: hypothetical protein NT118_13355, partial [Lentisphaerae bacterium]|nr:hypothetical protein [Lentisphaerota bacterium]